MLTFVKILFFPIWFPIKVLMLASKVLALVLLCTVLALLVAVFAR